MICGYVVLAFLGVVAASLAAFLLYGGVMAVKAMVTDDPAARAFLDKYGGGGGLL